MDKKKTVLYEVDCGVFVINNVLDALYQKFYNCIPKELENKVLDLIIESNKLLDITDNEFEEYNMISDKIVRKIKYEYFKPKKKKI